ncbi:hypothetical protein ACN267_25930 [Micromonospora sp. WMMD734]|uniref:Uncharacterized protein n=1 Tax=Micromonospora humidisoli TaxID=2807622 RepID=A0ABS2JJU3_9ACTN|nr:MULTISPECIES: hypothetical protein [Micromonospora]MBM7086649.1 hypothetical protein [Micromonospora humidisoli]
MLQLPVDGVFHLDTVLDGQLSTFELKPGGKGVLQQITDEVSVVVPLAAQLSPHGS